jgi:hypothetical protein
MKVFAVSLVAMLAVTLTAVAKNDMLGASGGGGGGMPLMTPGGTGSRSVTGNSLGAVGGTLARDVERARLGQKCRFVRGQGGSFPECQ